MNTRAISAREKERLVHRLTKQAVTLATEGKWEECISVNKAVLELSPSDVSAYNRWGKALMELEDYAQAREVYTHSLALDPYNKIARKNLNRLEFVAGQLPEVRAVSPQVEHSYSPEGVGSGDEAESIQPATQETIAEASSGDEEHSQVQHQPLDEAGEESSPEPESLKVLAAEEVVLEGGKDGNWDS